MDSMIRYLALPVTDQGTLFLLQSLNSSTLALLYRTVLDKNSNTVSLRNHTHHNISTIPRVEKADLSSPNGVSRASLHSKCHKFADTTSGVTVNLVPTAISCTRAPLPRALTLLAEPVMVCSSPIICRRYPCLPHPSQADYCSAGFGGGGTQTKLTDGWAPFSLPFSSTNIISPLRSDLLHGSSQHLGEITDRSRRRNRKKD